MNDPTAGIPNPFRQTVVADPWQAGQDDVPEIHDEAFRLCCDVLQAVRSGGQTRSVVVYGEAGSGKTHLLRRFRTYCVGDPPHAVDPIAPEVVFVAAKLQTSPQHLWRYLRQSLVDDLLRPGPDGTTQLERVLLRRFAEVRPADADLRLWFEWLCEAHPDPDDLRATLDDLFDQVDHTVRMGRDVCAVLGHLLLKRHRRDAKAWLRGDALPESALAALGLAPPADDADPEDQARAVVGALCRLAGAKVPVVFCFDQIEALQVDRRDTAALFAFGRVVMELFQQSENVLIVASVQISFLEPLKEAMLRPAWERLAMYRKAIDPLRWSEAVRLISARLDAVPELKAQRASRPGEPVWPLDEARLKARVGPLGETARRILAECADQFDAVQAGRQATGATRTPPRPSSPEAFLDETWRERLGRSRAENTPEKTDEVLAHGLPLLVRAAAPEWGLVADHDLRDVDLLWAGADGRVGVHFCNARDMRSVWRPLGRLPELLREKRLEKLVIARDARLPLTGERVRKAHEELRRQGAREIRPSAEVLAALDALRGLLSDAKAGDLTVHGRPVEPETVGAWLSARLPDGLRALADDLLAYPGLGEPAPADDLFDRLVTALDRRPVLPIAEAAEEFGVAAERLVDYVRERPDGFGLLEGPPPVLFRLVPANEAEGVER